MLQPRSINFTVEIERAKVLISAFLAGRTHYDSVVSKASKPHNVRIANSPRQTTVAAIKRGRGILKRKPGDKPFAEQWAEHKRAEKELEDAKYLRWTTRLKH